MINKDCSNSPSYPVVLCFSGNDATAGAGIAADIETLKNLGCHPSPVITTITIQDTINVKNFTPVTSDIVNAQARAVLADIPISAIKIGMISSINNVEIIHKILRDYNQLPVVLDPIIKAGGGTELANTEIMQVMIELLLPLTTVLTPNSHEARLLFNNQGLNNCAKQILETGCKYVLITGTDENTESVINTFYDQLGNIKIFSWQRLPEVYHGSGCTLASAIAGYLAKGFEPINAVINAQQFTWESLKNGYRLGKGQFLPNRFCQLHRASSGSRGLLWSDLQE